jgi:hypothetical protein
MNSLRRRLRRIDHPAGVTDVRRKRFARGEFFSSWPEAEHDEISAGTLRGS